LRLLEDEIYTRKSSPELPVWHLGAIGSLHRRDSTTMSIEPGMVDANVLVYGLDADAPQHPASRHLLDEGRSGATTLYVTSQILCEFYSIVTNPRRVAKPRRRRRRHRPRTAQACEHDFGIRRL